jgi:serine/threonine protein kinase/DNA-binding CsgD family transcriptional regulator
LPIAHNLNTDNQHHLECEMIGRKLRNRYEIVEHIGDGSTATVYKAVDTRLGREVALKILLPHVRDTTRLRFFQEARAAAQLNHANIMAIFDMDDEDDYHFLVVEFVQGKSLTNYIPSSPEVVIDLGKQISQALQYAHENSIIHRDIKPANIKVTPSNQVKIMDLGLALPKEATRVTAEGMVIGTPAYLSPEQAQGHSLDSRTDIYSLGVVLFEMATGHLPFDADEIPALLLQQVKQPPPPPRLLVPELPIELERIILRCLEKNPGRRYQSCGALTDALTSALANQPPSSTPARPPTSEIYTASGGKIVRSSKPSLRVILADDHTILRKTLASLLESRDDFIVVGEAADGDAALSLTTSILPDVLLLDLNMPVKGGLEVLPMIRAEAPNVKVIILTGREEEWYIMRALRSGAHGYILKATDEEELVESIFKVVQGQMVLGKGVAERIVTGLLGEGKDKINETEKLILLHVAAGYENTEIARQLNLSMSIMIETLAQIMNKLNAKDRNAAALRALREEIISLDDLHDLDV